MSDVMMGSDAKSTTLLFFLDQLAPGPRSLHDLSCQFGSPHFTSDMKQTVGNNKTGLKRFLLQFPSLFIIDGDEVRIAGAELLSSPTSSASMPSIMKTPPPLCKITPTSSNAKRQGSMSSDSSLCSPSRSEKETFPPSRNNSARPLLAQQNRSTNAEDDAVQYFKQKLDTFLLTHPNDEGMSLPSLLGHRSQALPHVRDACGRNAKELIAFIRRHRQTFLVIPSNDGYGQEVTLVQRPKPSPQASPVTGSVNREDLLPRQASQSLPLTEQSLIEFLYNVLRDKGAYFIEQLYGHLNAKYTRDERNEFARNPRELKTFIERYDNLFTLNENLVQLEPSAVQAIAINGLSNFLSSIIRPATKNQSRAELNGYHLENGHHADDKTDAESVASSKSAPQRITVHKTALEKAIRAAIESNEAHESHSSPHLARGDQSLPQKSDNRSSSSLASNVPWTEVTKIRHMKQIVREIFDVCDKIALHVILSADAGDESASPQTYRKVDYVFLVSSHDTAVYGFDTVAAAGTACLRDGGLRELLSSEKVTKYIFNASELGIASTHIFSEDYETLKLRNLYDVATANALSSYFSSSSTDRREKLEKFLLDSEPPPDLTSINEFELTVDHNLSQVATKYAIESPENQLKSSNTRRERIFQAYRKVKAYFPALSDAVQSALNLRHLPLLQQMTSGEQLERLRDPVLHALLKKQRDLHVQLDIMHDFMESRAATPAAAEADSAACLARECAIMRRLGQLSTQITQTRNERAVKTNLMREQERQKTATTAAAGAAENEEKRSAISNGNVDRNTAENDGNDGIEGESRKESFDVACQTVITGEIIAKYLFIGGRAKTVEF